MVVMHSIQFTQVIITIIMVGEAAYALVRLHPV
jgi:hypothetical protein